MKNLSKVLAFSMLLFFFSCYDDSKIISDVADLQSRVTELETLCSQMNTNITSLQTIVTSLQNNDYVTGVTPIIEGDKTIGYTINFTKSSPITIYNGIVGDNGKTPIVGIKVDTDGLYYWTVDGAWLLDSTSNKIKAIGIDGVTPQLKIENGHWYMSIDKGTTWTDMGQATGNTGEIGDSFFKSVTEDANGVYLILTDGTTITLSKQKSLAISFVESSEIGITAGGKATIKYALVGATKKTTVKAFGQNGWSAKTAMLNDSIGFITVSAPDPIIEDEIIVLVYDGDNRTIMSTLNFVTGVITIATDSYKLTEESGLQTIPINTNIDYTISIPQDAQSWLSVSKLRSMRTDSIVFTLTKNEWVTRYTTVSLIDNIGKTQKTIAFIQEGHVLVLNDVAPGTLSTLITQEQKSKIKKLVVTGTLGSADYLVFFEMPLLDTLDLSGLNNTTMPIKAFENNNTLQTVLLPSKLTSIPDEIFFKARIMSIIIPSSVTSIGTSAFDKCSSLKGELHIPESVISIGTTAFYGCSGLTGNLIIPNSVSVIGVYSFYGCSGFIGNLIIPNSVAEIGNGAFLSCSGFNGDLVIPSSVASIGNWAFKDCIGINKIYCKKMSPPVVGSEVFPNWKYLGVPIGAKTAYENATYWKNFMLIEEVDFNTKGY